MFAMKPTGAAPARRIVKVGIVGCGMITQVTHIPTLNALSHLFQVTCLYDVSEDAIKHSQFKVAGASKPRAAQSVEELCKSPEVDLVLLASNHAFHASEAILALQADKHVFIEKPIALSLQETDRIVAADKAAGGSKVFVGYMRRYAAAFIDAVKEVGSIGQIRYARVRDIIGPNSTFISQSATFLRTFNDYREADTADLHRKTQEDTKQALQNELDIDMTKDRKVIRDYLSMLGSHNLSAMREIIGMPTSVIGFLPCSTTRSPF